MPSRVHPVFSPSFGRLCEAPGLPKNILVRARARSRVWLSAPTRAALSFGPLAAFGAVESRLPHEARAGAGAVVDTCLRVRGVEGLRVVDVYTLDRAFNVQARANDQWALPSLDLKYHIPDWQFVSSTSYFYRHTEQARAGTFQ